MIFNPESRELYSSSGDLLKKLHCPYDFSWDDLEKTNTYHRKCEMCKIQVIDTAYHTENSIVELLNKDPNTCLRINLDQKNIIVTNHDLEKCR